LGLLLVGTEELASGHWVAELVSTRKQVQLVEQILERSLIVQRMQFAAGEPAQVISRREAKIVSHLKLGQWLKIPNSEQARSIEREATEVLEPMPTIVVLP